MMRSLRRRLQLRQRRRGPRDAATRFATDAVSADELIRPHPAARLGAIEIDLPSVMRLGFDRLAALVR